ncbi:MAG: hypothetical protein ACO1SV_08370 [Fimbriimonas sp.]
MRPRWPLIVASGIAATAVVVLGALWRSETKGRSLEEELAAARREGLPVDPESLYEPEVPEAENGAVPYLRASALTKAVRDKSWVRRYYALSTHDYTRRPLATLSKTERKRLLALLDLHGPAILALREAVARPKFVLYRPWERIAETPITDVMPVANLVRDLAMRAELNDLGGSPGKAWDDLLLAARGSALFRHGILPQENDERFKIQFAVLQSALAIAARHAEDPTTPRRLREIVDAFGPPGDPRRIYRSYLVEGRQAITLLGRGEMSAYSLRTYRDALEAAHVAYWRELYRRLPTDPLEFDAARRAISDAEREIYPESTFDTLTAIAPMMEGKIDELAQAEASHRMARAVADVLESRQRTGRWPKALPRAYPDPFGDVLRYRAEGHGFVVYSLSRDRADGRGVEQEFGSWGQDLVMRIGTRAPTLPRGVNTFGDFE